MKEERYKVEHYSIGKIINDDSIEIPDIQRPFVWTTNNIKKLLNSLYNGYPVGYLITWMSNDVALKNGSDSYGKKILIDGQQRVMSLKMVMNGTSLLDGQYNKINYRIAFNPLANDDEERFSVSQKNKTWIPDISILFKEDFNAYKFISNYVEINKDYEIEPTQISDAITKLQLIRNSQIGVIELDRELTIAEVSEIFARINTTGKTLNTSDFVMSKISADTIHNGNSLRKTIDYFSHLIRDSSFYTQLINTDKEFTTSEYINKISWVANINNEGNIYIPDYNDILRTCFIHKFIRGKLPNLVELLSGRDFETKTYKEEIADDSFNKLSSGILNFINKYNFTLFIDILKTAGLKLNVFAKSYAALNFAYALLLLISENNSVPVSERKHLIKKQIVMSILTDRYNVSQESTMEKDIKSINEQGLKEFLEDVEQVKLTDTFWNIELVHKLDSSMTNNKAFNMFIAAQIFNNDTPLFSNSGTIYDVIRSSQYDIHHIFPKEYLIQNGVKNTERYNQVANLVYLSKSTNIQVGKLAPNDYFTRAINQCKTQEHRIGDITDINQYYKNLEMNCIPIDIDYMTYKDYEDFLRERRKLMAQKIKKYYYSL